MPKITPVKTDEDLTVGFDIESDEELDDEDEFEDDVFNDEDEFVDDDEDDEDGIFDDYDEDDE